MRGFAPHWLKLAALALAASPVAACRAEAPADAATHASFALTGRVVDAADLLSPRQETQLTERLAALERDTKVQFVVVSTPSLGGYDIKDYTTRLGNDWGIGDRARDDGLLLVIAPNERQVRIGTGFGLERKLTDAECAKIIDQMLDYFRIGDLAGGTAFGAQELDQSVRAKLEHAS